MFRNILLKLEALRSGKASRHLCCRTEARSQVLRFGGQNTCLEGKDFVFIMCIFLGTTKFRGHKKFGVSLPPNATRGYGPGRNQGLRQTVLNVFVFYTLVRTSSRSNVLCSVETVQ